MPLAPEKLLRVPLFAALGREGLERLSGFAQLLQLERKRVLFSEGEAYRGLFVVLDGLFVVLDGLAVVYKLSGDGRMLILHVARPGDALGELPLFEPQDAGYPAHARTTRDSEVLLLPKAPFVGFLKQHPEVAWAMLVQLAGKLKDLNLRLEGVTLREVTSRLARYLLREVDAAGLAAEARPVLELPLAKGSIASYLGTVHETLSRSFARLVRDRVVRVEGPTVTILDKRRLERLA